MVAYNFNALIVDIYFSYSSVSSNIHITCNGVGTYLSNNPPWIGILLNVNLIATTLILEKWITPGKNDVTTLFFQNRSLKLQ